LKEPVTWALQVCDIDILQVCDIDMLSTARVDRISGGGARRAILARAFATEPRVFLLDEPTKDLGFAASSAIVRLLRGLRCSVDPARGLLPPC
jgi:ABC-type Mn2+/Zn2+ transport system ATPase subunit